MLLTLCIVFIRTGCGFGKIFLLFDNLFSAICVILVSTHFLFYFRAIHFIGSFILMIYRIVTRDISRFLFIYLIFITGFSQSYYVIFRTCERLNVKKMGKVKAAKWNIISNPIESFLRLFLAIVGEDHEFYDRFG